MGAAMAKVGQLPTACAFANHFTAGISIVEPTFEETVDWVRLGALRSRLG
jgi:hypothetical protein